MLFNSITYFVFLAIVYVVYRSLKHRGQNLLLLIASYVFYGWWDERFLFLIVVSTVVDYSCGLLIHGGAIRRTNRTIASLWLIASCLFFVVIDWSGLSAPTHGLSWEWARAATQDNGWAILVASIAAVIVAARKGGEIGSSPDCVCRISTRALNPELTGIEQFRRRQRT